MRGILERLFKRILLPSELAKFQAAFKAKFPQTEIIPTRIIWDLSRMEIGAETTGTMKVMMWLGPNQKLIIGNRVSLDGTTFVLGDQGHFSNSSIYPLRTERPDAAAKTQTDREGIIVEDDVVIGYGATIMSGLIIGRGAVVKAGSVVTRNVEPFSVVKGNPAKEIRKRDTPENKLSNLKLK